MMHSRWWQLPMWLMAALVLMPVLVILLSWHSAQVEVWQHLIATGLSRLLKNTLMLMLGVGVMVMLLGVSLAWLTAVCEFPGRRWLDWALVLPLAIPTYVVAFVALGLMSYSGPVLTAWRAVFGPKAWYPEIRSPLGVILVMGAVLYPYVYMLARSAFLQQGRTLTDAARVLGRGPFASFTQVVLPMARPAIVAGMALALMEALADFGAVAVFNYDTFTTAIYKSWFGFFNLQAAAQLASLLLLFVAIALVLELQARGRGKLHQHGNKKQERIRLRGWRGALASAYCLLVLTLAFLVPFCQLVLWVIKTGFAGFDARFLALARHTFLLGAISAILVGVMALLVAFGQRLAPTRGSASITRLTALGYALPGSVLAVGVIIVFTFLDRNLLWPLMRMVWGESQVAGQVLVGSVAALVTAYGIRYFSVGLGPVQSSLERIRPQFQEVAQSLGHSHWQVLRRVYLPLLTPGLMTALILVLVDVMKEMPATLLLRPFGWDTLAVRVYEMTSEGEWQRAALPALTLVLISMVPVILMVRRSRSDG
jgi:iron(III) transport system permease protein